MYLDSSCSCNGKNLDKMLQPGILMCVLDYSKYGHEIIQELGSNPMFDGMVPDKTGVYRYLKRMAASGYLEAVPDLYDLQKQPRLRYSITEQGKTCLRAWRETLRSYAMSIGELVDWIDTRAHALEELKEHPAETSGRSELQKQKTEPEKPSAELYLLTGFLGAGKSTLLKEILKQFAGKKVQVIINEFGRENVDGVLLASYGFGLEEITGGSVFCSCRIDQFEQALRTFVKEDTEVVLVEASGLSDPTGVRNLLTETERFPHISYRGSICLIDAVRFPKVYAKSRTCVKQVAAADIGVINKVDLASEEQLEAVRAIIADQRPDLKLFETSYGRIGEEVFNALKEAGTRADAQHMPLTADLTTRSLAVNALQPVPTATLEHFLKRFVEMTFRVKGFIETTDAGLCLVNCVGNLISIEPYGDAVPADKTGMLVILSGAGMPVKKHVRGAVEAYQEYFAL